MSATSGGVRSDPATSVPPGVPCATFPPVDAQLRHLLDRLEIDDLLTRYATAVDLRDWDLLDFVFTEDARLDYRSAGGICGAFDDVRRWLSEVLALFGGDPAPGGEPRRRDRPGRQDSPLPLHFQNPNRLVVDGEPWLFVVGGCYHDRLVRTPAGWRIRSRVEETLWWDHPMPGLPATPYALPDDAIL